MKAKNWGLIAIFAMISSILTHSFLLKKEINWSYIALGSLLYVSINLVCSILKDASTVTPSDKVMLNKFFLGSHFSYLILAGGIFFVIDDFGRVFQVLLVSFSLGISIPFFLSDVD